MGTKVIPYINGEVLEWRWWSDSKLISFKLFASSFLIDGLLIDANAPGSVTDLHKWVEDLGGKNAISSCFLTHFHEDHAGGAPMLKKEFGIPIFSSNLTVPYLKKSYKYRFYRKIYWGKKGQEAVDVKAINESIKTKSGKYSFELFPMHGHSPDLTALVDKKHQIAFVGDALVYKYGYLFGGTSPDLHENIMQIYKSQKEFCRYTEKMKDLQIFVAHVGKVDREFLIKKIEEIENLHSKAHLIKTDLIKKGYSKKSKIIREIVNKIWVKGELKQFKFISMGEISRANLVVSLLDWPIES
ncbi:MAG: MBL fold metallo-hydrolase [Promethearchaeota archaeon]